MGQQEIDDAYHIRPSFLEALVIRSYIPLQSRKALTKNFTAQESPPYGMVINGKEFDLLSSSPRGGMEPHFSENNRR